MGGIDHAAHELRSEFVADENPLRLAETLCDDEELVFVGKVEKGVDEQHNSIRMSGE